jgi:hypothetical protein
MTTMTFDGRLQPTPVVLASLNSVVLSVFLAVSAAAGEPAALNELLAAKIVRCTFDRGSTTDWDSGNPTTKIWEARSNDTLTFDAIDYKHRTARAIGSVGAATVEAFITPAGAHFIEESFAGNVALTSILSSKVGPEFVMVHSRHMIYRSGPTLSQEHGRCRILP